MNSAHPPLEYNDGWPVMPPPPTRGLIAEVTWLRRHGKKVTLEESQFDSRFWERGELTFLAGVVAIKKANLFQDWLFLYLGIVSDDRVDQQLTRRYSPPAAHYSQ
ncbi:hypothetical protein HSX11_24380 [Oxalobacteraceae bacterium]|nr:hypothetical protein [Oxalobacteraceae bacterium]